MTQQIPTPANTPAVGDPGDDTARRFAYQWTFAAILACGIFDDTMDVVEVFCEHHEDVLLKHGDGTFTGVQVKTRETGGNPWTATEESIFGACCRFVCLENQFPGRFRCFIVATNHTFLSNKTTGTCLPHLLTLAQQAADETSANPTLKRHLTKLNKKTGHPESVCLATLKKCRCDHSLPKLDHVKQELANTLSESWDGAADAVLPSLIRAADGLTAECQRASSLDHAQTLPRYVSVGATAADAAIEAAINGKRLNRERIERVLREALASTSLLASPTPPRPEVAVPGRSKLDVKLNAGGFSTVSITAAKELRDKADYKSLEWMSRLGENEGLKRHEHIRTVVLRDCADAFEQSKTQNAPFGLAMQTALRARFVQRRGQPQGTTLFDCLDEHLEGHAYSLTKECKVWWSETFTIQEGA